MNNRAFKATLEDVVGEPEEWYASSLPADSLEDWLNANSPVATRLDGKARKLCRLYLDATPKQRDIARAAVSAVIMDVLYHFAWRMAVRALRKGSPESLKLGLVAISLANGRGDRYESLQWLLLLHYAAVRTGLDADAYFHEVAAISTERTSKTILAVMGRPPERMSVGPAIFREGVSEFGPTIETSGAEKGEGTTRGRKGEGSRTKSVAPPPDSPHVLRVPPK